ncbi:hypothetical protein BSKO_01604 [Bryopsis sp. KO-2023]|nr:hypothetical protein BSKO_01604 [Bryopsis sp. KO-2023]
MLMLAARALAESGSIDKAVEVGNEAVRVCAVDPGLLWHKAEESGHWKWLGIAEGSSKNQIRRAFLQKASKWHPDKWQSGTPQEVALAEHNFIKSHTAYESLCNGN